MKELIKINIIEHYCPNDDPVNMSILIKTDNVKELKTNIQNAYLEYLNTGYEYPYKNDEEAKEDGIYFGNTIMYIPPEIQKKHNFEIINIPELEADFDYGFEY